VVLIGGDRSTLKLQICFMISHLRAVSLAISGAGKRYNSGRKATDGVWLLGTIWGAAVGIAATLLYLRNLRRN
jgi:hypothetical protein